MVFELMTVGRAADKFCEVYGLESAVPIANQIRYLISTRVFVPGSSRKEGRHTVAEFDTPDLCKLRLISHMVSMGVPPEILRGASALMNNIELATIANRPAKIGWSGLIDKIAAGGDYVFVLHVQREGAHAGGFQLASKDARAPELMRPNNVGTYLLPATEILRPLIRNLLGMAED